MNIQSALPNAKKDTHSKCHAAKPSLPLVKSVSGHTSSQDFDRRFGDVVAIEVLSDLEEFRGWGVILNVYSPPWEGTPPQGMLNLCFVLGEEEKVIGIVFGAERDEKNTPYQRFFEASDWREDPSNPFSAGIFASNWDECWYIACKILEGMSPKTIQLSFGA